MSLILLTDVSQSSPRASIYTGEFVALYVGSSIYLCMCEFTYSTNKLSTYYVSGSVLDNNDMVISKITKHFLPLWHFILVEGRWMKNK